MSSRRLINTSAAPLLPACKTRSRHRPLPLFFRGDAAKCEGYIELAIRASLLHFSPLFRGSTRRAGARLLLYFALFGYFSPGNSIRPRLAFARGRQIFLTRGRGRFLFLARVGRVWGFIRRASGASGVRGFVYFSIGGGPGRKFIKSGDGNGFAPVVPQRFVVRVVSAPGDE